MVLHAPGSISSFAFFVLCIDWRFYWHRIADQRSGLVSWCDDTRGLSADFTLDAEDGGPFTCIRLLLWLLQQINQAVAAFVPVRVVECELKLYTAACNVSV